MNIPDTYYVNSSSRLPECNADSWQLYHKKSGARIFILKNDDKNRVFTIGFRTPPGDSTGLPHILEHSVLCGSRKFPVKDPFIELQKGSLQTFMNAMTYPDKTIYPVASCNEKDFRNLMDVYMDAVFHPLIYKEEKIFRQEGWHYELETPESPLTINGVVYNEMKGAFSSPDEILERCCQEVLYPDTPYTYESGGDPEVIPTLTYEDFLAFHSRYYHPSNSFIYLYGDLDVEEQLRWLDEEYLGRCEAKVSDSRIPLQPAFSEPEERVIPYPLDAEEDPAGKAYLSQQWVTGDITDPLENMALQMLETVLLSMPGAPVRQALTDAGIGDEVYGGYQSSSRQPYFSVVAKNADEDRKEEFLDIIRKTLEQEADNGIDRKSLEAAINIAEFKFREADFGSIPRGLIYGIWCFDSWLYDADPTIHLRYEKTLSTLREHLEDTFFEDLIRKYFLDNPHQAVLVLHPVPGLTEQKDRELEETLAAKKASMTEEEIRELVRQTEELAAYQSEPSTPEALETLPSLKRSDISPEAEALNNHVKEAAGIPVIHHEIFTGGIIYLIFLFPMDRIREEDISCAALLKSVLSLMSTSGHDYRELASDTAFYTGGIGLAITSSPDYLHPGEFAPYLSINTRVLREKLPHALSLIREILIGTVFSDEKRLKELLLEIKSRTLSGLQNSGHTTAVARCMSYSSRMGRFDELSAGVDYYRFLEQTAADIETPEGMQALIRKLSEIAETIFVKDRMVISLTAEEKDFDSVSRELGGFLEGFPESAPDCARQQEDRTRPGRTTWPLLHEKKNEAFRTAAQIQYVAVGGNPDEYGGARCENTGALRVLQKILSDEYLWNNIRVKGGAYGCMCRFGWLGGGYFVSYRDPNLRRTMDTFRGVAAYLRDFRASEEDITRYIIGTIGGMDHPMTPPRSGERSLKSYLSNVEQERLQRERDQVIGCTAEDIRGLADHIQGILDLNQLCVVGNAGKIEEEEELFGSLETLA